MDWLLLCQEYGHRCLSCGKGGKLSVDHVVPLAKGGTNDLSNIQPLCLRCNQRKGTRVEDYRPYIVGAAV
jgi:5-methylcytosine-specific restriction protein A